MKRRDKSKKRGTFLAALFLTKNRRGSHVGMILSFVIFITFVVFLFAVFKPAVGQGENKQTTLQDIESRIELNVSANFTSTSVQINSSKNPGTGCIKLQNFLIFTEMNSPHIIVKDETQALQSGYFGMGSDFGMLAIDRSNPGSLFFRVYYSPEFEEIGSTYGTCDQVNEGDYEISLTVRGRYIFEKNMYLLIDSYANDYESLKKELNVPAGNEFGFGFTQSNGTKIEAGGTGKQNVYSEEIPVQYIDNNANILSGFINVKVW
jgi:hypothetical protein